MDRCVLLTSTPECVVLTRRAINAGLNVNNTHLSMINPDYNMMPAISIRIDQYTVYQKQIKSRAITVGVAMSPRNLDGKYRCRPHPRSRKCTPQFFAGSRTC